MTTPLTPASPEELADAIRSVPGVIAVGAGTKPRLGEVSDRFAPVSMLGLRGIVEYEPDEYTITALAGTPLAELEAALGKQGQDLPFDPLFRESGSTLGGAVAAGASGPGRFRYGGVRDFILGVRFVDGSGQLLRVGGKVVKNAAGFDLPKFFVGSCGRFGVLAEVTLKVFPRPSASLTLRSQPETIDQAVRILQEAGSSRWQLDALDIPPAGRGVLLRLAGPASALKPLSQEILARWPGEVVAEAAAETLWSDLREARWAPLGGVLLKLALSLTDVAPIIGLVRGIDGGLVHISAGGNVAFVWIPSRAAASFDAQLRAHALAAITLRGRAPLWLGKQDGTQITRAVKNALDARGRFPALED